MLGLEPPAEAEATTADHELWTLARFNRRDGFCNMVDAIDLQSHRRVVDDETSVRDLGYCLTKLPKFRVYRAVAGPGQPLFPNGTPRA